MTTTLLPRPAAFIAVAAAFLTIMAAAGAPSVLLRHYQQAWGFPDSQLTIAFATYAFTLLLALMTLGSLSDHLGRRPVALGALLLNIAAFVQFLLADGIGAVILARAVQGAGAGVGTAVFSALILEYASERSRRAAQIVVSVVTSGGLGIGVVVTGVTTQSGLDPTAAIFTTAVLVLVICAVLLLFSPETGRARAGAWRALVPRIRVPRSVRGLFLRLVPALVAVWMSAGLILGLGASIASQTLDLTNGPVAALVVAAQPLASTLCMVLIAPRLSLHRRFPIGFATFLVGMSLETLSLSVSSPVLIVLGAVTTGVGFGLLFSASLQAMLPHVAADGRAAFFSGFYAVGYLSYGVSAIAAGFLSDLVGLRGAAIAYAAATTAVAAAAVFAIGSGGAKRARARSDAPQKATTGSAG